MILEFLPEDILEEFRFVHRRSTSGEDDDDIG